MITQRNPEITYFSGSTFQDNKDHFIYLEYSVRQIDEKIRAAYKIY